MTDTKPNPHGSSDIEVGADSNDDPQDRDSLQQQARQETSKAEGEDPDDEQDLQIPRPPITNPD